jgi:hypothetical protein
MTRIDDRIDRRIALAQLTAATILATGPARAQRPDPSLASIKTTDLGRKTYMLEGQGGNILVVIGDDGIIMVDAELAPLHDEIKAAITKNSNLPIKYLVDTRFHGSRLAAMPRSIVTAPSLWRRIADPLACRHHQWPQRQQEPTGALECGPARNLCRGQQDCGGPWPRGAAHPCHQRAH